MSYDLQEEQPAYDTNALFGMLFYVITKVLSIFPTYNSRLGASHLETIGEWDRLGGPIITNACAPKWFQELLHPKLAWTHSSYSVYRVNKSVMALFYPQSTLFCQVVGCKSSYNSRAVMGYLNLHASLCSQVLQGRLPHTLVIYVISFIF